MPLTLSHEDFKSINGWLRQDCDASEIQDLHVAPSGELMGSKIPQPEDSNKFTQCDVNSKVVLKQLHSVTLHTRRG